MLAFGHDDDALGVRVFHQRVRDLLGDAFLHLRATRVQLHQSGELAQSDDLPVGRDVADMRDAVERQQMMLAHREQLDVAHQHHFIGLDRETLGQHLLRAASEP